MRDIPSGDGVHEAVLGGSACFACEECLSIVLKMPHAVDTWMTCVMGSDVERRV